MLNLNIPENKERENEIKKAEAKKAEYMGKIAAYILAELDRTGCACVCCSNHMVGRYSDCFEFSDTLTVAKEFKKKGYFTYYRNYVNGHGVNQKEVTVSKSPVKVWGSLAEL